MDEPKFYAIDPLDAYPEAVGTLDKIEHSDGALWVHLNGKRSKLVGLQSLAFLIGQLEQIRAQVFGGGTGAVPERMTYALAEKLSDHPMTYMNAYDAGLEAGIAAKPELAALWEELATANQVIEIQRKGLLTNGGVVRQLLTAAEQRNAELESVLREIKRTPIPEQSSRLVAMSMREVAIVALKSRANERSHEIPGTSGQRLNQQANEGE